VSGNLPSVHPGLVAQAAPEAKVGGRGGGWKKQRRLGASVMVLMHGSQHLCTLHCGW
jgi:hypothetical protein